MESIAPESTPEFSGNAESGKHADLSRWRIGEADA